MKKPRSKKVTPVPAPDPVVKTAPQEDPKAQIQRPIVVVTNSFTAAKMQAIVNLSEAVAEMARAIGTAVTRIEVKDVAVSNVVGTAIHFQNTEQADVTTFSADY